MSLFKVGRKQNEKVNLKRTKGAPKANIKPSKEAKIEDDDIDSDEELRKQQHKYRDVGDDMATFETTQDKRIRLAKQYLRHVQEQQQDREEYEDETELTKDMARSLKESYLSTTGKTYRPLAAKLTSFDLDNATTLHWKMQRLSPTCCTLSENNATLYVGCKSGWIVRWDLKNAKRTASFHVKNCNVKSLSVSHDMKYLAVADGTDEIKVLDGTSMVQMNTLKGHSKAVNGVAFRKGSYQLYSCSADRTVKVWSLDEMVYIETLYGHQSEVSGIDALSIERIVTSGGMDQSLRVWKVAEETQLVFNALTEDFSAVKFVNTELFISGSIEGSLCLWSCGKKKPLHRIALAHGEEDVGHPNWISSVGVLANSDVIASGSCDGFVRVWKLANKRRSIEPLLTIPVVGFINAIEFTSDGRFLIIAVGQEHRLGRWWTLRNAKNRTLVIPLSIDV